MSHPNTDQFPQPKLEPKLETKLEPKLETPNRTMIYYSRPSLSKPIPTQLWPPPQWVTSPPPIRRPAPSSLVEPPPLTSSSQQPEVQLPNQPEAQLPKQPEIQLPEQREIKLPKLPDIQSPKKSGHMCPKTGLQELTHRLKIPLPQYETVSVLSQQRLTFRSTVTVKGEKFASPNTFRTRKAAEKDAAGIALKHLSQKMSEEDISLSPEDIVSYKSFLNEVGLVFCKSILHEFAAKADMGKPSYNTRNPEESVPLFVSSLDFNGASYTGSGKSKKEAEQLVARAVITSLLDVPKMGKILSYVIYSKWKQYESVQKISYPSITKPLPFNATHSSPIVPSQVIEAPTIVDTLPNAGSDSSASVVPVSNVPPVNEFSVEKPDKSIQATDLLEPASSKVLGLPIEFVDSSSVAIGPRPSKKRHKIKNQG